MSMNLILLPQNKTLFDSNQLATFVIFAQMRANDPDTFVKNEGYHFEDEAKVSVLGP